MFFKNRARLFMLNYFYSCLFSENSLLLYSEKKTFVTTNERLFTLQNQYFFASNPISVCICCCCCANNACIRCCIISYYWNCWLIADLHFLFKQVFLNSALSFVFQFTSFSSNYLTRLFKLFAGNIVNIKGFLVVLNKNCLSSFVYHVLFRSQPLLRSRISCREIWYYVCYSQPWPDFLLPAFCIKFFFTALPAHGSDKFLPCIPSFTISTFVLRNTLSNNFAKHFDAFLF